MRMLVKDLTWMSLYAAAMTGFIVIPLVAVFGIVWAENTLRGTEQTIFMVAFLLAGIFVFFFNGALFQVLQHRRDLLERGALTGLANDEETQLMQELHQRSLKMDRRLESLETILLGRAEHREHSEY